ncbi:MAG: response regulator [Acidimicrobiia bacterium]
MSGSIIIADDNEEFIKEFEKNFSLNGYEIITASNGQEAFDLCVEKQPDLVILDIVMPVLDGLQTCKKIRENPSTSAVSVILLASESVASEKIRGLELGADDYMSKPIVWDEFIARVNSLIRRAEQLRDLSAITNLPGNYRVSNELAHLVAENNKKYALLNIEIEYFKSINDRYGSGRGDKVIKFMGKMLSGIMSEVKTEPSLLGHIGGSRFVIITSPEKAESLCNLIIEQFDGGIKEFYDEDARAQGYIELTNRKNEPIKLPIAKVCIGVVSTEFREVRSGWEATATAKEMCEHAKRYDKSAYEIDRRSTDDQFLAMLNS